ncbi:MULTISPECIES: hypothetical protein [Micrococcaceae]|uniref:hypothetical protein n=1 Tax=unclassified Kocuria TaxID=2649579 RepID=UPI001012124D|nr:MULTISPECIES: hypothetical protein [unclassified Kocuria]
MYDTQPVSVTMLTIPPQYVQDESQWALQICEKYRWGLQTSSCPVRDPDRTPIAEDIASLTRTFISLGWRITPKDRSDPSAGIVWHRTPQDPEAVREAICLAAAKHRVTTGRTILAPKATGTSDRKEEHHD